MSLGALGHVCIIGDFNAQLGREAGPRATSCTWSNQGKRLYQMMLRCNLVAADLLDTAAGPDYSFDRLGADGQSYIDHCLISVDLVPFVRRCGVMSEDPLNFSDHLPVYIELNSNITQINNKCQAPKTSVAWKRSSISVIRTNYTEKVSSCLYQLTNKYGLRPSACLSNKSTDDIITEMTTCLRVIAIQNLPLTSFRQHVKSFWTNDLNSLKKQTKAAWHCWVSAGRPRSGDVHHKYKKKKREYRKMVRRAEFNSDIEYCKSVCQSNTVDQKTFWKLVNKRRKVKHTKVSSVKSPVSGKVANDTSSILNVFRDHFNKLALPSENERFDDNHKKIEIPLFKGKGKDPLCVDNYRKMSRMTIISKIFEKLICNRNACMFKHCDTRQLAGRSTAILFQH